MPIPDPSCTLPNSLKSSCWTGPELRDKLDWLKSSAQMGRGLLPLQDSTLRAILFSSLS